MIPPELGFNQKGRERDNLKDDQKLYYTVQLVDLFRPGTHLFKQNKFCNLVPGDEWTTDEGIQIKVTHKIDEDKCRKSVPGDTLHQHYKLHLADGTFIDSSFSRGTTFNFKLGANQVIRGMDIGNFLINLMTFQKNENA